MKKRREKGVKNIFPADCRMFMACVSISAGRKTPGRKKDNDLQSRL